MGIVFFLLTTSSIIVLGISAPESVFAVMLEGAKDAISLSFKMLAVYCIWLSFLQIMTASGLDKKIGKLLRPITKRLFKGENDACLDNVNLNLTANLLGIGGVATPAGIRAIENMKKSDEKLKATHNMVLFIVINATSIQLLPASIVGMRAAAGSASASDIILPTLLATIVSTLVGFFLCKAFGGKGGKETNVKSDKKRKTVIENLSCESTKNCNTEKTNCPNPLNPIAKKSIFKNMRHNKNDK